jgi:hypothetical protein
MNDVDKLSTDNIITISSGNYRSIAEYDSMEKALPPSRREDGLNAVSLKK